MRHARFEWDEDGRCGRFASTSDTWSYRTHEHAALCRGKVGTCLDFVELTHAGQRQKAAENHADGSYLVNVWSRPCACCGEPYEIETSVEGDWARKWPDARYRCQNCRDNFVKRDWTPNYRWHAIINQLKGTPNA